MTMNLFYFGFVGWIVFIAGEAYRNYWMPKRQGKRPNYLGNFMYRSFFGLVCFIMMNPDFDPLYDLRTVWQGRWIAGYQVSSFYLSFDPLLNAFMKRRWNYKGKNSGWLDKLSMGLYYSLKIACVILLGYSLYKMF